VLARGGDDSGHIQMTEWEDHSVVETAGGKRVESHITATSEL